MIMAKVWRNERYSGGERKRVRDGPMAERERKEDRATNAKERNMKRRRKRREWAHEEKEKYGVKEVEKGHGMRYEGGGKRSF